MNKKYRVYNTMYDVMRSKRASASKKQSRNKKLSQRHSFSNPPINTKQRRKIRLQQPYVHTQLAIATCARKMKELTGKEVRVRQLSVREKRRKLIQLVTVLIISTNGLQKRTYVRTQLTIATTVLERLELIYCIINEQGKTIINTTKVITTIEHSKTPHDTEIIKKEIKHSYLAIVKKERSTPKGVM